MPFLFPTANPSPSPEEVWTTAFNRLSQRMRGYFVRSESHQRALAYMQGLMSSVERKNGWQVSEEVGDEADPLLWSPETWELQLLFKNNRTGIAERSMEPDPVQGLKIIAETEDSKADKMEMQKLI